NIYDGRYATDFNRLSRLFLDGRSKFSIPTSTDFADTAQRWPMCGVFTLSPRTQLKHSQADEHVPDPSTPLEYHPAYTRAYIHHLLHTHEMSAHALLTTHNLSVVDRFFADIRGVLERDGVDKFREEVQTFRNRYDDDEIVVGGIVGREAKRDWGSVDKARGKGRLARDKEKSGAAVLEEAEVA
ncbi:hypothetical protein BJ322DRAFT_1015684, partial [Thelephora terrestris]